MEKQLPDRKELKDTLRDATKLESDLASLPLKYAEILRTQAKGLDTESRKQAIELIGGWVCYAERHQVLADDPFAIRFHITRFAEETFGKERETEELSSVDISEVMSNCKSYQETIEPFVSPEIIEDREVAIIGGVARLALKMHAGVATQEELPINDVDVVVSARVDIPARAQEYKFDLTGAKVVDGDIGEELPSLITNFDCTMNQVAVYNGQLLFSDRALKDIKEGNIRLIAKDDPLFGSEGVRMPDGNVYLSRSGFYRGLSFLLRGKGERLIVSKENLEAEKDNIGRYWLVLLFVKILPIKNDDARKKAIGHWHEVAKRIGSTETDNPESFLNELMAQYPEMREYSGAEGTYDVDAQVRWLIGKLTSKSVDKIYGTETVTLPVTYTPDNLELSDDVADFDFDSFMKAVKSSSELIS